MIWAAGSSCSLTTSPLPFPHFLLFIFHKSTLLNEVRVCLISLYLANPPKFNNGTEIMLQNQKPPKPKL